MESRLGIHVNPNLSKLLASTMDFDDEAPPDLVEVSGGAEEDEEKEVPFKVPITIVTGMPPIYSQLFRAA